MEILILILVFSGIFAIYDAIRKVNNNILAQTEEIKKLHEELAKNNRN